MSTDELRFAKTHEWIRVDGETATVGISEFAVELLTDLVFIDLPEVGGSVTAGDVFGEVESVKAASDLYAPVSGEIVAVNDSLPDNLGALSDDPYQSGWIIKMKLSEASELSNLMDNAAYAAHCDSERSH